MVIDTGCYIAVIIERFYKLSCFNSFVFIQSNFCSVIVNDRSSAQLVISCPPYTVRIITGIRQRKGRLAIAHNSFFLIQHCFKIIQAADIQFAVCIELNAGFLKDIFVVVHNLSMSIQRNCVDLTVKGYRIKRVLRVHGGKVYAQLIQVIVQRLYNTLVNQLRKLGHMRKSDVRSFVSCYCGLQFGVVVCPYKGNGLNLFAGAGCIIVIDNLGHVLAVTTGEQRPHNKLVLIYFYLTRVIYRTIFVYIGSFALCFI